MDNVLKIGVTSNNTTSFWGNNPQYLLDFGDLYLVAELGDNKQVSDFSKYFAKLIKSNNVRLAISDNNVLRFYTVVGVGGLSPFNLAVGIGYDDEASTVGVAYLMIIDMHNYDESIPEGESIGIFIGIPEASDFNE